MDDLISRQAAIDAFLTSTSDGDKAEWCIWVLEKVPSAQPEIIRCKDYKYWDVLGYCVDFMTQDENGFCSWAERRIDETD